MGIDLKRRPCLDASLWASCPPASNGHQVHSNTHTRSLKRIAALAGSRRLRELLRVAW